MKVSHNDEGRVDSADKFYHSFTVTVKVVFKSLIKVKEIYTEKSSLFTQFLLYICHVLFQYLTSHLQSDVRLM